MNADDLTRARASAYDRGHDHGHGSVACRSAHGYMSQRSRRYPNENDG